MARRIASIFIAEEKAYIALLYKKKRLSIESVSSRPLKGLTSALDDLPTPILVCFITRDALFGTGEFPTGKTTFMELNIRKSVIDTGILHGPFLLRFRTQEKRERFSQVSYLAIPFQERERVLQIIVPQDHPIGGLFTLQTSLSALASQWTNEPAGVIYPTKYGYECTFFQRGSAIYSRIIPPTTAQEPDAFRSFMEETLRFLKQSQGFTPSSLYAFNEEALSLLSPFKDSYTISMAPIQEILPPGLHEAPEVLAPLIGNLLAPPEFNLMEEEYTAELKATHWSKRIYWGALGMSLAVLLLTLEQGVDLVMLRHRYISAHNALQKEIAQILRVQPTQKEIQDMIKFLKLYQAFQNQPKLDRFLVWLSTHTPPRATITQMKAKPEGAQTTNASPKEAFPQANGLQIEIEGKLIGGYYEVKGDFYTFVGEMEKIADVRESQFDYGQGEGEFTIKALYPKKQGLL